MKFQCKVHGITFDIGNHDGRVVECPYCLQETFDKMRIEYHTLKRQRDVLVEAIGIVKTIHVIE